MQGIGRQAAANDSSAVYCEAANEIPRRRRVACYRLPALLSEEKLPDFIFAETAEAFLIIRFMHYTGIPQANI